MSGSGRSTLGLGRTGRRGGLRCFGFAPALLRSCERLVVLRCLLACADLRGSRSRSRSHPRPPSGSTRSRGGSGFEAFLQGDAESQLDVDDVQHFLILRRRNVIHGGFAVLVNVIDVGPMLNQQLDEMCSSVKTCPGQRVTSLTTHTHTHIHTYTHPYTRTYMHTYTKLNVRVSYGRSETKEDAPVDKVGIGLMFQ